MGFPIDFDTIQILSAGYAGTLDMFLNSVGCGTIHNDVIALVCQDTKTGIKNSSTILEVGDNISLLP